jgi:hypothetical protein
LLPPGFAQNVTNMTWSASIFSTARAPGQLAVRRFELAHFERRKHVPAVGGFYDQQLPAGLLRHDDKPAQNVAFCAGYPSGDHSGAPEFGSRLSLMHGGGSGGGGSNWTGFWSSTPTAVGFVCANTAVSRGDTATISFWHNKNGNALILAVNGGGSFTALGTWLVINYPYLFGPSSPNNMAEPDKRNGCSSVYDVLQRYRAKDLRSRL